MMFKLPKVNEHDLLIEYPVRLKGTRSPKAITINLYCKRCGAKLFLFDYQFECECKKVGDDE